MKVLLRQLWVGSTYYQWRPNAFTSEWKLFMKNTCFYRHGYLFEGNCSLSYKRVMDFTQLYSNPSITLKLNLFSKREGCIQNFIHFKVLNLTMLQKDPIVLSRCYTQYLTYQTDITFSLPKIMPSMP